MGRMDALGRQQAHHHSGHQAPCHMLLQPSLHLTKDVSDFKESKVLKDIRRVLHDWTFALGHVGQRCLLVVKASMQPA